MRSALFTVLVLVVAVFPAGASASHNEFSGDAAQLSVPAADADDSIRHDNFNASFTYETDENFTCGGAYYGATVWYAITFPETGTFEVLTAFDGLGIDPVISIYRDHPAEGTYDASGPCNSAPASTETAVLNLNVGKGESYLIQIGTRYTPTPNNPPYDPATDPACCPEDNFTLEFHYRVNYDLDGDGALRPPRGGDCDDGNGNIRPGAAEIVNNDVDENCDGYADFDRDGDGSRVSRSTRDLSVRSLPGSDCDDGNPGIRPSVREIRGNRVDENCDGSAEPAIVVPSAIRISYSGFFRRYSTVTKITVKNVLAGSTVRLSCKRKRCALRKRSQRVKRNGANVSLRKWLRKSRVRAGAVLQVVVLPPSGEWIGKTRSDAIRAGKGPKTADRCIGFGANRPSKCPKG